MKIFIERPVATAMGFLCLLALGVFSFLNTPIELAPEETFPTLDLYASWPGVPPEIIQTQVTSYLEEACLKVKGVKKVTSTSGIGQARLTLEFDAKTNMEFATLALREELAKTRDVLPARVRPTLVPYVPEDFQVRPFLQYTISGDYGLQELQEIVKDKLEIGLGAIRGVSRVGVMGGSEPELRVVLDKEKIKAYGVHPYAVSAAVSARLATYPSGRVRRGSQEFLFKFADKITSPAELERTIVAYSGENPIYVRDVATVETAYRDIYNIHRINGQPTVSMTIAKERGRNHVVSDND